MVVTWGQQYHVGEKPIVILYTYIINRHSLLFLIFRVLAANPKKLLYTVANPARGLLNREMYNVECVCDTGSLFLPICMYVWSTLSAGMVWINRVSLQVLLVDM